MKTLLGWAHYECGFRLICPLWAQVLSSLYFQRPHKKFLFFYWTSHTLSRNLKWGWPVRPLASDFGDQQISQEHPATGTDERRDPWSLPPRAAYTLYVIIPAMLLRKAENRHRPSLPLFSPTASSVLFPFPLSLFFPSLSWSTLGHIFASVINHLYLRTSTFTNIKIWIDHHYISVIKFLWVKYA